MAYEVGVLCRVPDALSPRQVIATLCGRLTRAPETQDLSQGDSIASCEVKATDSSADFVVTVHISNPTVFDLAQQAWKEGLTTTPEAYDMVVEFTLSGDSWVLVRHLLSVLIAEWDGILFDEVAGFAARLD